MEHPLRILGLDPGLGTTGWGVLEVTGPNSPSCVAWGQIRPPPKQDLAQRLAALYQGLEQVLKQYQPDEAAVEATFVNQNPKSTLQLGMARGVVLVAPAHAGLWVESYSANQIKKTVTGQGHATKTQVGHMVGQLLNLEELPPPDAADALAIALCHLQHRRWKLLDHSA